MINLNVKSSVCAKFKCTTYKDKKQTKTTDWFSNLVLDSGLIRMRTGNATEFLAVGTSNIAPSVEQTGLGSLVAYTNNVVLLTSGISTSESGDEYIWAKYKYVFAVGAAVGNLAEIGLGWRDVASNTYNNMFNRSLIKDSSGNNTVITVLSDESLEVEVEMQHYPSQGSAGTFNLTKDGVISTHSVKIGFLGSYFAGEPSLNPTILNAYGEISVYAGELPASHTTEPGFPRYEGAGMQRVITHPTPTSLLYSPTFSASQANLAHRTLIVLINGLIGRHRLALEITPAITKPSTHKMTYNVLFEWGRYEPA